MTTIGLEQQYVGVVVGGLGVGVTVGPVGVLVGAKVFVGSGVYVGGNVGNCAYVAADDTKISTTAANTFITHPTLAE